MVSVSNKTNSDGHKRVKTFGPYRGVRMRSWGTWVSEIRRPLSKERIWLGSFDSPEKAARAYDAALHCLRGSEGKYNFPDDERPEVPTSNSISSSDVKAIAAEFAAARCTSPKCSSPELISPIPTMNSSEVPLFPTMNTLEAPSFPVLNPPDASPFLTTNLPEVVVDRVVKPEIKSEGCDSISRASSKEHEAFSPDSFLLDDALTFEPDSLWAILEETKEFTEAK